MPDPQPRASILILEANPLNLERLRTSVELKELQRVLQPQGFQIHFGLAVQPDELQALLRQHRPDILHFAGHGDEDGALFAENEEGNAAAIPMAALAEAVRIYNHEQPGKLRLALLNACDSAQEAALLARHTGCVIAALEPIHDESALTFAAEFYRSLADGSSTATAYAYGCNQANLFEYLPPVTDALTLVTRPDVDADQVIFTRTLSSDHLEYLRRWFDKSWAKVSLADLSERRERVNLVDVYVPLPVDFGVVVKTKEQKIEEWWEDFSPEPMIGTDNKAVQSDESVRRGVVIGLRDWSSLGVKEVDLQPIINGIQSTIWSHSDDYANGEHPWSMEAHDAASVQPLFVLVGDPGSGKSSFLRHLALCHAGELRRVAGDGDVPEKANLAAMRDWLLGAFTPIFVELHDLVREVFPKLSDDEKVVVDLPTTEHLWRYLETKLLHGGLAAFQPELRDLLRDGRAIVLLDGLDEVNAADDPRRRRQIRSFVAALVEAYPRTRFVVTSRPHAYRRGEWQLDGFGRAELRPLSSGRLRELATALFSAIGQADAPEQAKDFVDAVERRKVPEDIRGTPLFFTLLSALWLGSATEPDGARDLPTTRGELYHRSVDLLLSKWTMQRLPARSLADDLALSPDQLRTVLEILAYQIHERAETQGDAVVFDLKDLLDVIYDVNNRAIQGDVIDYLEQQAGILIALEPKRFRFVHWSFQEHLAACELLRLPGEERRPPVPDERIFPDGLLRRVQERSNLWENVARLAADELARRGQVDCLQQLIRDICLPYLHGEGMPSVAILGLEMADSHELVRHVEDEYDPLVNLANLLRGSAEALLVDVTLVPERRDVAGRTLCVLGDRRKGVGLRADGLPDIDWVEIPEIDAEIGQREFIYQEDERRVEPTFWITRYPVTYHQFQTLVDAADGFRNDEWWAGLDASEQHRSAPGAQSFAHWNHPRENVSWYDAIAFCRWLTAMARNMPDLAPPMPPDAGAAWRFTLPTEWQWEKSARGYDGRVFPWGNEYISGYANINETYRDQKVGDHYLQKTSAVGMYAQGVSPYGIHDMSGNVWEWCLNEHGSPDNIQESGSELRALRGGSWDGYLSLARSVLRDLSHPDYRNFLYGFRIAAFPVPIGSAL